MFSIQFNNYNSYKDLGLVVEHRPNIPAPQKNINFINIEGRNGSLIEDLGTYRDIEISINFGFKDKESFLDKVRLIKHWLNNIEDRQLKFSDDEIIFYKVKYVRCDGIERSMRTLGRFTVECICEPFSYFMEGLEAIEIKNSTTIYSPELIYSSEPVIKVYGQGNITLNINNYSIKLKDVQEHITIDSTLQECYKDNLNCNNKMVGEFPLLAEENKIDWTGNINKIEIIPNWRCL